MGLSLTNKFLLANFLSLKLKDAVLVTQTYVDNTVVATYSQPITNINSVLTNKTANRNFLTLKVHNVGTNNY